MEIFSGEYSRDMWVEINSAKTVGDLQNALYLVCCRLQEFETELASSSPNKKLKLDAKEEKYCEVCGIAHNDGLPSCENYPPHDLT
jgi:hypothetical protein